MDESLVAIMSAGEGDIVEKETTLRKKIRFLDEASGEVEVSDDSGATRLTLKPLADLYGPGTGAPAANPKDERFMPLFLGIEEEITRFDAEHPGLTDGGALLALNELSMSPESAPAAPLARRLQMALRLILSLNNYSRQEVRQALRHVAKSVERHTRIDGPRGYLRFIREFFGRHL